MGWSAFRKVGLTHFEPSQAERGYTLVTPYAGYETYLIDMMGRIVHRWQFSSGCPFYARLLPNGNLMAIVTDGSVEKPTGHLQDQTGAKAPQGLRTGPSCTHLVELDWDSNVVWTYVNHAMHHDFVPLAGGNILVNLHVEVPDEIATEVRRVLANPKGLPPLVADEFMEIDRDGRELNRVQLWRLLDPHEDRICPLDRRSAWTHTNSLDYSEESGILFSARTISTVGIVDNSGSLAWKFGPSIISHQHHATFLKNGNVQLFDNGAHREGWQRSAVLEVDPRKNTIPWEYTADPDIQFFSAHISGAERLPNGNTLVCEGAPGRLFEVTPRGNIVWEWISPFSIKGPPGWPGAGTLNSWVFRAHRFGLDHPAIKDRELDPDKYRRLNELYGLGVR